MKKLLTLLFAIGLCTTLAIAPSFAAEEAAAEAAPAADEGPVYGSNIGDVAKPLDLKTFAGEAFNTNNLEGKTMYVFVNSVCGLCARQMRDLGKHADKFEGVPVYLVAVDMTLDRVAKKYEKYTDKFGALHDPDFAFGDAVGLLSTPSTLVLDKDGTILYKQSGYRPEYLKAVLAVVK